MEFRVGTVLVGLRSTPTGSPAQLYTRVASVPQDTISERLHDPISTTLTALTISSVRCIPPSPTHPQRNLAGEETHAKIARAHSHRRTLTDEHVASELQEPY